MVVEEKTKTKKETNTTKNKKNQILQQEEITKAQKIDEEKEKNESKKLENDIKNNNEPTLQEEKKVQKEEKIDKKKDENKKIEQSLQTTDVNKAIAEVKENLNQDLQQANTNEPKKNKKSIFKTLATIILVILALILLSFTIFTVTNMNSTVFSKGVSVLSLDVSSLNKQEAINKVSNQLAIALSNNVNLIHNEYETNISLEELNVVFTVEDAVNTAFNENQDENPIFNSLKKLHLLYEPIDIWPTITLNEEQLTTTLDNISTQLPDAVIDSSYYIEDNNLIITTGRKGVIVDTEKTKEIIKDAISDLSFLNTKLELATISKEPNPIDIESIYNEIHKDAKDAYYTTNPFVVYPDENGLDFSISLDEAKQLLTTGQEEYTIPLKVLYPNITTNMIGTEAFPDLLASFSTKYTASNRDRTTNLRLASNKINGTVILPGETFSYNTVVGERTIAAGYKEAAVYQNGQVVNGLGGGICQISTTLYNAALFANLEIVERRNHQFVPSYVGAGRDATVVYGSQDFKFKNNRSYAIKIESSVEGGIAHVNIYGLREDNEYDVSISAQITSRTANYLKSVTYKTLSLNGQVVSSEAIAHDTYKVH